MPALRFVPPRMRLVRLYGRRWWGLRAASPRPALVLILGFAALIVAGTLALLLPISVHRGGHADLLTALFTATSAVCVTGLTVVDTGPYWAPFGQAVILVLMEVGGLGFVIGATALVLLLRRRLSIRQRVILQDIGATSALGVGRLAVRTVLFTLGCEAAGALLLWLRFGPRFGAGYGLWLAVFHAVSAFTNGSFDLFGGHGKSLADYRADPLVLLTMAGLIISGGLSFLTLHEVVRTRRWRRLSLDSKVILLGTGLLLLGGTALLLLTEADNPASLGRLPFAERVLNAFFHAAAARTSGFTTWDFAHSDPRSLFFLLGLMFIGGAPGSMAGGIKITTAGAIVAGVWGAVRGDADSPLLGRRLPPGQLAQALAVAALALGLILNITLAISLIEGHRLRLPFINLLFEVTSAFGTVGFSAGVTAQLSTASRLLLIATMFVGRLGPVTVAAALAERHRALPYRLPSEPIRIG